ncbi:MAG: hypothetical protein KAT62_11735 [Desulfuromonadales bacterium]|nr:hypothetical protein [Desulfuromonadales bacterium]
MKNPSSFLSAVLISFAALLFFAAGAGAFGIPDAPPPTPVNPADVNTSTSTSTPTYTPVCVQYKSMTVTYVCGTEEKCYDLGKEKMCVEVEKLCERLENVCVQWQ